MHNFQFFSIKLWLSCSIMYVAEIKQHCTRLFGSFCAPLNRYIGLHIDWHPTDVSGDISTYRPTLNRYVGQHINRHSADITTEICWSTYQPTYQRINRDTEGWLAYRSTIGRYLGRYSGWHLADTLTIDYWRNMGRLSVVYRWTVL